MTDSELMQLSEQVGQALKARGATVTTAESCTGGWVAKVITDIAGSSVWFAFATARGEGITRRECFSGDRDAVRRQATAYALQTLWQQFLQNT
ncbi:competence damage-inducible protein A [Shigella sonnei]|uniref:CinA family protein n=1 Tax=Shigella sonnei TaxID=624 RepID=UPI0006630E5F|nr:CinA family protein [Shigella sonnei]CSF42918.1 competence damage-inducible protein A [Shigella sonnei]